MTVLKTALCLSTGLCLAAPAHAIIEEISYSTSVQLTRGVAVTDDVDDRWDYFDQSGSFSLPQFDPALGTLRNVQVRLAAPTSLGIHGGYRDPDAFSRVAGYQFLAVTFGYRLAGVDIGAQTLAIEDRCEFNGLEELRAKVSCGTNAKLDGLSYYKTGGPAEDPRYGFVNRYTYSPLAMLPFIGTGDITGSVAESARLFTNETDGDNGTVYYRYGNFDTLAFFNVIYYYDVAVAPPPPPPPPVDVPAPGALALLGLGTLGIGMRRRTTGD